LKSPHERFDKKRGKHTVIKAIRARLRDDPGLVIGAKLGFLPPRYWTKTFYVTVVLNDGKHPSKSPAKQKAASRDLLIEVAAQKLLWAEAQQRPLLGEKGYKRSMK
jgi:hypothetical protein